MDSYPLPLTRHDCIFLSDSLSVYHGPTGFGERNEGIFELLSKVLSALLTFPEPMSKAGETFDSETTTSIPVSEYQLWVIREVSKSAAVMSTGYPVGLMMLYKAAKGIRAFATEHDTTQVAGDIPTGDVYDDVTAKQRERLEQFRKENSHADESAGQNGPDDSAQDGPCAAV